MQLSALNNAGFCIGKINHRGIPQPREHGEIHFYGSSRDKILCLCVFVVISDFNLIAQGTDVKINDKIL